MTHFTLVRASLWRRPLRTISALLAFTAAVAPCLVGISATSKVSAMQAAFDQPFVRVASFFGDPLPLGTRARISSVPGVAGVEWYSLALGDDGTGRTHYGIWGCSAGYLDAVSPRMLRPVDPASMPRWQATRNGALVTKDLADRMHWRVDQTVELKSSAGSVAVVVVGLLEGYTLERVVVHYDLMNAAMKLDNSVSAFAARSTNSDLDALAAAIDAASRNSSARTISVSYRSFGASMFAATPRMDFLVQQTLLLLVVGVAVSANAVAASIRERRAELAALRAIGFSHLRVALLIVAEAELIAVSGALLAVLPLVSLFHERGLSLGPGPLNGITISAEHGFYALAGAAVLGLVAGVLPVLAHGSRVSSLDLVEA